MRGSSTLEGGRAAVLVSVGAFVVLGLSESGLGTAWPSMAAQIGQPLTDLGTLLAVGVTGYGGASLVSGKVVKSIGPGWSALAAAAVSLAGVSLYAFAHSWIALLSASLVLGGGGGLLDTTVNSHAAHNFTPGATNLLHAGFGIGATMGPLLMAQVVASGSGWRFGYLIVGAAEGLLLATLLRVRRRWPRRRSVSRPVAPLRKELVVFLSLMMFLLYTGIEVSAGQWSFSLLTESRGLGIRAAGAWVGAYWAGLTTGRLALSAVASRLGPPRVLTMSMAGTIVGLSFFWWNPGGLGVVGLPFTGLSLAGVFPTLVILTPTRIGLERTTAMVGYQLAAASLGAATIPWLIGRTIGATSLETLGPILLFAAIAMATLHVVLQSERVAWWPRRGEEPG